MPLDRFDRFAFCDHICLAPVVRRRSCKQPIANRFPRNFTSAWTENPVKNESKKKVLLSSEQIQKAADIYHTWQSEGTDGANYAVPELYRSVRKDEIEKQGWSLVPSKYIEFIDHDLEIDYAAEMSRIQKEMREVLKQEMKSQKMLEDAFRGIGYELA